MVKVYKRFVRKIYFDLEELSQRRWEQSQEEISLWARDRSKEETMDGNRIHHQHRG